MSLSEAERAAARANYSWDSVVKDLALWTPLTISTASEFSRVYMESSGIHPYDLVEWVGDFYGRAGLVSFPPSALRALVLVAFRAGRESS